MYLDLDKPVGPVTGKWCVRKFHSAWAVYDGFGIWWGDFETFQEAIHWVTHPVERLSDWVNTQGQDVRGLTAEDPKGKA